MIFIDSTMRFMLSQSLAGGLLVVLYGIHSIRILRHKWPTNFLGKRVLFGNLKVEVAICFLSTHHYYYNVQSRNANTVEPLYSGHPWDYKSVQYKEVSLFQRLL